MRARPGKGQSYSLQSHIRKQKALHPLDLRLVVVAGQLVAILVPIGHLDEAFIGPGRGVSSWGLRCPFRRKERGSSFSNIPGWRVQRHLLPLRGSIGINHDKIPRSLLAGLDTLHGRRDIDNAKVVVNLVFAAVDDPCPLVRRTRMLGGRSCNHLQSMYLAWARALYYQGNMNEFIVSNLLASRG